ncbi:hypothetical protein CEXT_388101 [Caerostris extrusa]|uniref:Uncharacterized protein n=1 Tax=Caerostris extrusa TaxID=172846 RepID=A0AAV4RAL9_CAEEX|nr:hypothetical protein CEXT_388101 [Caerostris extrusa]
MPSKAEYKMLFLCQMHQASKGEEYNVRPQRVPGIQNLPKAQSSLIMKSPFTKFPKEPNINCFLAQQTICGNAVGSELELESSLVQNEEYLTKGSANPASVQKLNFSTTLPQDVSYKQVLTEISSSLPIPANPSLKCPEYNRIAVQQPVPQRCKKVDKFTRATLQASSEINKGHGTLKLCATFFPSLQKKKKNPNSFSSH